MIIISLLMIQVVTPEHEFLVRIVSSKNPEIQLVCLPCLPGVLSLYCRHINSLTQHQFTSSTKQPQQSDIFNLFVRVSCFPSLDYVHVRIGSSAADKKPVEGKGVGIKVRPSSSTSTGQLINQVSCCVVPLSCSIPTNSTFSFSSIMVNLRLDISDDQKHIY